MEALPKRQLRTNENTFGSIEFYTGGQIGINKGSTVEITSDDTANIINLKGGGLWGKMAKQKEDLEARRESLAQLKRQHGID